MMYMRYEIESLQADFSMKNKTTSSFFGILKSRGDYLIFAFIASFSYDASVFYII